jgi:hypothetical protein
MTTGALSIMMLCPECVSVICCAPGTSAASSFWAAEFAGSMTAPKSGGVSDDSSPRRPASALALPRRPSGPESHQNPAVPDPRRPRGLACEDPCDRAAERVRDEDVWARYSNSLRQGDEIVDPSCGLVSAGAEGLIG